jgi:hypothetical protein
LPPVLLSSLDAQDLPLPQQVLAGHDVPGYVSADFFLRPPQKPFCYSPLGRIVHPGKAARSPLSTLTPHHAPSFTG